MRWLHYDPLCVEEVEFRADMTRRFARFWSQLTDRISVLENALSGGTAWDWQAWLDELLNDVDPRWQWRILPEERSDHWRMTISARTHRTTRPMLRDFLDSAPQIPAWTLAEWLPTMSYAAARRFVRQQTRQDCDHLAVSARLNESGRIDLRFVQSPEAPPASTRQWLTAAKTAAEALLGEERFEKHVGDLMMTEVERDRSWWRRSRKDTATDDFLELTQLSTLIDALIDLHHDRLPPAPLSRLIEAQGWTTVEIEPSCEVRHTRRNDLRLLTAALPALPILKSAHASNRFRSDLFSRFAEQFCYLQWEHDTSDDESLLARREAIDSSLGATLFESQSGCVVGGGIGESYLYFDIAVTNWKAAIPVIRKSLLGHDPPHRCWLRFFDEELAEEWIGIHPDAVAPPDLG